MASREKQDMEALRRKNDEVRVECTVGDTVYWIQPMIPKDPHRLCVTRFDPKGKKRSSWHPGSIIGVRTGNLLQLVVLYPEIKDQLEGVSKKFFA